MFSAPPDQVTQLNNVMVWGDIWTQSVKIPMFPSPTGYTCDLSAVVEYSIDFPKMIAKLP